MAFNPLKVFLFVVGGTAAATAAALVSGALTPNPAGMPATATSLPAPVAPPTPGIGSATVAAAPPSVAPAGPEAPPPAAGSAPDTIAAPEVQLPAPDAATPPGTTGPASASAPPEGASPLEPATPAPAGEVSQQAALAPPGAGEAIRAPPAGDEGGARAPNDEPAAPAAPAATAPVTRAQPEPAAAAVPPPIFDLLRVEPDGSTVVAGKAIPDARVELLLRDTPLGETVAGPTGDFAIVLDEPLPPGDHEIALAATPPDGAPVTSEQTAIVSVPQDENGQVLAMVEEPGQPSRLITLPEAPADVASAGPAEAPADAGPVPRPGAVPAGSDPVPEPNAPGGGEANGVEPAPTGPGAAASTPAEQLVPPSTEAPTVNGSGGTVRGSGEAPGPPSAGGEDVAKRPDAAAAPGQDMAALPNEQDPSRSAEALAAPGVAVQAVEIDGRKVYVAGLSEPGTSVRVYAGADFLGETRTSPQGQFLVEAVRELPVGEYLVRADVIDRSGKVIARAAVPFDREPGEAIAAVAPELNQTRVPQDGTGSAARGSAATGQPASSGPDEEPSQSRDLAAGAGGVAATGETSPADPNAPSDPAKQPQVAAVPTPEVGNTKPDDSADGDRSADADASASASRTGEGADWAKQPQLAAGPAPEVGNTTPDASADGDRSADADASAAASRTGEAAVAADESRPTDDGSVVGNPSGAAKLPSADEGSGEPTDRPSDLSMRQQPSAGTQRETDVSSAPEGAAPLPPGSAPAVSQAETDTNSHANAARAQAGVGGQGAGLEERAEAASGQDEAVTSEESAEARGGAADRTPRNAAVPGAEPTGSQPGAAGSAGNASEPAATGPGEAPSSPAQVAGQAPEAVAGSAQPTGPASSQPTPKPEPPQAADAGSTGRSQPFRDGLSDDGADVASGRGEAAEPGPDGASSAQVATRQGPGSSARPLTDAAGRDGVGREGSASGGAGADTRAGAEGRARSEEGEGAPPDPRPVDMAAVAPRGGEDLAADLSGDDPGAQVARSRDKRAGSVEPLPGASEGANGQARAAVTDVARAPGGGEHPEQTADRRSGAPKPGESPEGASNATNPAQGGAEVGSVAVSPKLQSVSGSVIIRRGDSLWRISRRVYGRGVRYSTIYLANQDQIRDPDRIWPGQVFAVPNNARDGAPADLNALGDQAKVPGPPATN